MGHKTHNHHHHQQGIFKKKIHFFHKIFLKQCQRREKRKGYLGFCNGAINECVKISSYLWNVRVVSERRWKRSQLSWVVLCCALMEFMAVTAMKETVMVEMGIEEESGKEMEMASTSCSNKNPLTMEETCPSYKLYLPPLAKYEEVVDSSALFRSTLEKVHASMGTKFMVPTIGGKELDLHRLFVEVTSRGGIEKIIRERRWKEVTSVFNFPSTATNASFVLRKYYVSLLQHYEQIYFFRARGWIPISTDFPQNTSSRGKNRFFKPKVQDAAELHGASPSRYPVIGVIDGKIESGYLVTVTIGSQKLKGILYQSPPIPENVVQHNIDGNDNYSNVTATPSSIIQRRKRRKKCEIKRRDPNRPKPNRSGYNFFFAEQHGKLKPLHPGKDREISRMIGELWKTLNDSDRTEKAVKDKERYNLEMEEYREKLKTVSQS